MKKLIFIVSTFLLTMNLFAEKIKITQDANLRTKPSKDSEIIKVLEKDTIVEGERYQNSDWYQVKAKEFNGYVHKSLISEGFNTKIIMKHPFLLGVIFFILIIIIIKTGKGTKCPNCKRWFARKKIRKEFLDSSGHYATKNRTDIQRNSRGEQIGTIERQEQIHVTTNHYRQYCKCKYCNYNYSYIFSTTHEG